MTAKKVAPEPVEIPRLNAAAAKSLDTITRAVVSAGFEAVKLTYLSRSWKDLGYASFEAWAAGMPKYQLTRDERKALVTELDGLGMTQRQIASTVGAGKSQVNRDLVPNGPEPDPDRAQDDAPLVPNGTTEEPDHAQSEASVGASAPTEPPIRAQDDAPIEADAPPKPTLVPDAKPDLHEAAAAIPETDKGFRSTVDQVLAMLIWLDPENNRPITEVKISEARRILDRIEELRQEWLPYIGATKIKEMP